MFFTRSLSVCVCVFKHTSSCFHSIASAGLFSLFSLYVNFVCVWKTLSKWMELKVGVKINNNNSHKRDSKLYVYTTIHVQTWFVRITCYLSERTKKNSKIWLQRISLSTNHAKKREEEQKLFLIQFENAFSSYIYVYNIYVSTRLIRVL